jgi:hypothetical protein
LREEDRDVVLPRLKDRAAAMLPTLGEMLLTLEEAEDDRRPLVSPLLVVGVVSAALICGIGAGAILSNDGQSSPAAAAPASQSPSPTPTVTKHKHKHKPTPSATPSRTPSATPSAKPSPTKSSKPSPTPSPTPKTALPRTMTINPTTGPSGTVITVSGDNWAPKEQIFLEFLDREGNPASSKTVRADKNGSFSGTVTADDTLGLPALDDGRRKVSASDGTKSKSATFVLTA